MVNKPHQKCRQEDVVGSRVIKLNIFLIPLQALIYNAGSRTPQYKTLTLVYDVSFLIRKATVKQYRRRKQKYFEMAWPRSMLVTLLLLAVCISADRYRSTFVLRILQMFKLPWYCFTVTICYILNVGIFPYAGYERTAACEALCGMEDSDSEEPYEIPRLVGRANPKPLPRPCTNPIGCQANGHIKEWVVGLFKPSPTPPPPTPKPPKYPDWPPPPPRRPRPIIS